MCVVTNAPLLPHQLRRLAARAAFGISACGGHGVGYHTSGDIIIALSNSPDCAPQVLMKQEWERPDVVAEASMGGRPSIPPAESHRNISGGNVRRMVETQIVQTVVHSSIDGLFMAAAEATEEAILNSLCQAEDLLSFDGTLHKALDCDRVRELLNQYRVV